jgi:hypothetical protein
MLDNSAAIDIGECRRDLAAGHWAPGSSADLAVGLLSLVRQRPCDEQGVQLPPPFTKTVLLPRAASGAASRIASCGWRGTRRRIAGTATCGGARPVSAACVWRSYWLGDPAAAGGGQPPSLRQSRLQGQASWGSKCAVATVLPKSFSSGPADGCPTAQRSQSPTAARQFTGGVGRKCLIRGMRRRAPAPCPRFFGLAYRVAS